jgi:hypothetical protein
MSASPPIPTELMRHNKTSRGAASRLVHRSKNPAFEAVAQHADEQEADSNHAAIMF